MSNKNTGYEICAGAICKCTFGKAPATFKVLAQSRHYINDAGGVKKLIGTHKEIGQPFESPFFGSCSKMNNSPCAVNIIAWNEFYDGVTYDNGAHPLLEGSKGTCPTGAKDCITFTWHGQVALPGLDNIKKNAVSVINPLVKQKQIVEILWKYGDDNSDLQNDSKHSADLKLYVKTKGYKEGEHIEITVGYDDGSDLFKGEQEITYKGKVDNIGMVIIKDVFKNKTVNIYYED